MWNCRVIGTHGGCLRWSCIIAGQISLFVVLCNSSRNCCWLKQSLKLFDFEDFVQRVLPSTVWVWILGCNSIDQRSLSIFDIWNWLSKFRNREILDMLSKYRIERICGRVTIQTPSVYARQYRLPWNRACFGFYLPVVCIVAVHRVTLS